MFSIIVDVVEITFNCRIVSCIDARRTRVKTVIACAGLNEIGIFISIIVSRAGPTSLNITIIYSAASTAFYNLCLLNCGAVIDIEVKYAIVSIYISTAYIKDAASETGGSIFAIFACFVIDNGAVY